jgi:putative Mg2+ transporter-C (MgtC) family protein
MSIFGTYGPQVQILIHVAIAMGLGAIIGLERELEKKPAGLRTHMLVTGAAALVVGLGDLLVEHFATDIGSQFVRSDPVRIFQAIITGVSFLGAGTILRQQGSDQVEGLTTAASLLFAAGVGVSVGLAKFVLAVGATLLVLVTLRGLGFIDRRLRR